MKNKRRNLIIDDLLRHGGNSGTENGRKGAATENQAVVEAVIWKGETIERMLRNNPGYDFKSKKHGGCFKSM